MQDVDHIYNAMHSGEVTDRGVSVQNRHNSAVHGPERCCQTNASSSQFADQM